MSTPYTASARAMGAAAVALVAWWLAAPRAAMPPVWPMGDQPVYAGTVPVPVALIEPVLHAPWIASATPTTRTLGAVITLAGGSLAAASLGSALLATLLILIAFAIDASAGASLWGSGTAIAVGLFWLSLAVGHRPDARLSTVGRARIVAALVIWALAVWWHWLALVAAPLVFLRVAGDRARRRWLAPILGVGAVASFAYFQSIAAIATARAFAPGVTMTWRDALAVAFDPRAATPSESFVGPELTAGMGPLVVGLAVAGLIFGRLRASMVIGCAASAVLTLIVAIAWPQWRSEVARFALWAIAPLAALGLTWVSAHVAPGARSAIATLGLGLVSVVASLTSGARPWTGPEPRQFRDALAAGLAERTGSAPAVIVAEDSRVDAAIASWASDRAGVTRAPQDGRVVAAALRQGLLVLAGPMGRRHLELSGVDFDEGFGFTIPMAFAMAAATTAMGCAGVGADEWSTLPGVEYTGRLGIAMPAGRGGELHLIFSDPIEPRLRATAADGRPLAIVVEPLMNGAATALPPADYWFDGGAEEGPRVVRRVRVPAGEADARLMSLQLGRRAPRVLARLVGVEEAVRARVCAAPVSRLSWPGATTADGQVSVQDEGVFGAGFYDVEGRGADAFRWADADAVLMLRSRTRDAVAVTLHAEAAGTEARADAPGDERSISPTVSLRVNGVDVGARDLRRGTLRYEWAVPAGVWTTGTNELMWHTSRAVRPADTGGTDTRRLALRVTRIEVTRPASAAATAGK